MPQYDRGGVNPTLQRPPLTIDETGAAIAQLGGAVMAQGERLAQLQRQQKEREDAAWVGRTLAETRAALTMQQLAAEDAAAPGAAGFTAARMSEVDAALASALASAPSDEARAVLEERFAELRTAAFVDAHRFERASATAKAGLDYQAAIDANAATLLAAPDKFDAAIAEAEAMARALLPASAQDEAIAAARKTLTASYAQGRVRTDPEGLREEVLSGRLAPFAGGLDARYLDMAEAEIARRQAEAERAAKEAQAEAAALVKTQLADALAEIQFTGTTTIDVERTAAALPADAQAEVSAALTEARRFYADTQRLALLDPAGRAAVLHSLEPRGEGAAAELERYEAAARAVAAVEKEWAEDPALAAARYSPSYRAAIEGASDPAELQRAAQLGLEVQRTAGVPEERRRVLTDGQAKAYVADLADPEKMLTTLDGLAANYGPLWPRVQAELLAAGAPPEMQVIDVARSDPLFGPAYAAARASGLASLRKLVGDGQAGEAAAVEEAVDMALDPFFRSEPDGQLASTVREAVLLTALELRRRGGLDATQAATRAAATFVAGEEGHAALVGRYGYVELDDGSTLRVPRPWEPDVIEEGLREVLERIGSLPLDLFGATDPEDERAALVEALQEGGRFIISEDESGVHLYDAQLAPVLLHGQRLFFDWQTLAAFAESADETDSVPLPGAR